MGIENVGRKTARDLSKNFADFDQLKNATLDDLIKVADVGEVVSDCIVKYFEDLQNIADIEKLFEYGVKIKYQTQEKTGVFANEKVVLTGTLTEFKRDEASKIIESLGGEIMSSVSKNTTLVLAGENAGSKLDKAKKLGIKIIDEQMFKMLVKS